MEQDIKFKKIRIWNEVSEFRMFTAVCLYCFGLGLGINTEANSIQFLISLGTIIFAISLGYFKTYKVRYIKESKR